MARLLACFGPTTAVLLTVEMSGQHTWPDMIDIMG
jgi:alkylresorcinol/alkylpyrone synthase